jgi:glycosyltransferase involved in cell wall biosynthesis
MASPKKIKFIFTVHNLLSKDAFEANHLSLWAERLTYNKRQTIVAVSREVLHDYDVWVGIKGKSFVLYNYVHDKFFDLSFNPCSDVSAGLKLIAVGNLRRQKNYSTLLDAFSLLRDLPVTLDIFGGGDLHDELAEKIERDRLKVRLMGRVSDVSKVLTAYHAYVMPSLFEGFGIAPMEAMAAGMPVILSDLSVFREIAEDVPVYFEPRDPMSIADAIKSVYANWGEVSLKTNKGKIIIKRKASKEMYLKKLTEIYGA